MASKTKTVLSGICASLAVALVVVGCAVTPTETMVRNDVRKAESYFGLAESGFDCVYGAHSITVTGDSGEKKYEFCANQNFQAAKRLTDCLIGTSPKGKELDKVWCDEAGSMIAADFGDSSWLRVECNTHDSDHEMKMANGMWVGVCEDHIAGDPVPAKKRVRE